MTLFAPIERFNKNAYFTGKFLGSRLIRLTRYTDYAMRTLIFTAARPGRLSSIGEIARAYGISKSHLMKVVTDLVAAGYLEGLRGRNGGIRLARPASQINIGEVVRYTEEGFDLVDCGSCMIARACGFTGALNRALAAFMDVLDGYTLEDLVGSKSDMAALFASGGTDGADEVMGTPARGQ